MHVNSFYTSKKTMNVILYQIYFQIHFQKSYKTSMQKYVLWVELQNICHRTNRVNLKVPFIFKWNYCRLDYSMFYNSTLNYLND